MSICALQKFQTRASAATSGCSFGVIIPWRLQGGFTLKQHVLGDSGSPALSPSNVRRSSVPKVPNFAVWHINRAMIANASQPDFARLCSLVAGAQPKLSFAQVALV